ESHAGPAALYRPGEAASRLGVPISTLRLWSARFGGLLSDHGSGRARSRDGRPGHRVYTASDLGTLMRGKDLLGRGLTYEEGERELSAAVHGTAAGPGSAARAATDDGRAGQAGEREGKVGNARAEVAATLLGLLGTAESLAAAWQAIAEERSRELAECRQRVVELDEELQMVRAR